MKALTRPFLGARLRAARESMGISQQAAARHLGLKSHHPIVRMESGERDVSTIELVKLARLYARPLSYFTGEPAEPERDDWHEVARELSPSDRREAAGAVERCREFDRLLRALDRSPRTFQARVDGQVTARSSAEAAQVAEAAARTVRDALGLGHRPIENLPRVVEEQGIGVFRVSLDSPNIVGFSLRGSAGTGCIVVEAKMPANDQALAVAHHFWHILADRTPCLLRRRATASRDKVEYQADHFAKAFLMPRLGLEAYREADLGVRWSELTPVHALRLQHHLRVSYATLLDRLRDLDLFRDDEHRRLSAVAVNVRERLYCDEAESAMQRSMTFDFRLRVWALQAYERGKISRGRLCSLLGVDDGEVAVLTRELGVDSPEVPSRRGPNPLRATVQAH